MLAKFLLPLLQALILTLFYNAFLQLLLSAIMLATVLTLLDGPALLLLAILVFSLFEGALVRVLLATRSLIACLCATVLISTCR